MFEHVISQISSFGSVAASVVSYSRVLYMRSMCSSKRHISKRVEREHILVEVYVLFVVVAVLGARVLSVAHVADLGHVVAVVRRLQKVLAAHASAHSSQPIWSFLNMLNISIIHI